MRASKYFLVFLLYACGASAQSGSVTSDFPAASDYAWGFPVLVQEDASFYSLQLPLDVNRSVTDAELRDAGVYNADGDPVPRLFQPVSDDVLQIERTRPLPYVPLTTNPENVANDELRLLFERRGDYARLELSTDENDNAPPEKPITAYIVDTRALDEAVEALDLYWTQLSDGFVGQVRIDGSNDLRNWKALGAAAIADLNEASTSIVQRRVDLSGSPYDYLRLTWEGLPDDWSLAEINGIYTLGVSNIVREPLNLAPADIDPSDGGRIFVLHGAPKIDQLRIALANTNTVVSTDIYLWSVGQSRWYRVLQGNWHHIGRGDNIVESAAENISRTRTSKVKVVVTHGQPDADMQLEIGWLPDTLLFLAHGTGPFTLVAGRAADADSGFPQHRTYNLRSMTELAASRGQAAEATLGPRFALGGEDQLVASQGIAWRKLILWLGLLLGVTFVGFMAMRILHETRNPDS